MNASSCSARFGAAGPERELNATGGEMNLLLKWTRATAAFLLLFCGAFTFGADSAAGLKSAEELVAALEARIDKPIDIPTEFSCDVLTAEQRDCKAIIFKSGADWNKKESVVWEWDPAKELPNFASRFGHISECKPCSGLSEVLVAASSGGVARIRVADKKVLFYGNAGGNTHSIAKLPDGNIVAASSTGKYVSLFAVPKEYEETGATAETPVLKKFPLDGAHGVVWDAKRSLLWALGYTAIVGYEYVGTKEEPDLKETVRVPLEGTQAGGHDLYPAPGYDALMTTGVGINVFDPNSHKFYSVSPMKRVKSISLSPEGTLLMQRAVVEWWSETIFYGDDKNSAVGTYKDARFYKARWFTPNTFSDGE